MAKRRLSKKLKEQIKANPYKIKYDTLSSDSLKYLKRVKAGRKAAKTRAEKAKYKAPKKKSEAAPEGVAEHIQMAARKKGMTEKQYRKKYAEEVAKYETEQELEYKREYEIVKKDIKFLKRGGKVFNKDRRTTRHYMIYLLVRLYNHMQATGLIYDKVLIVYFVNDSNMHLNIPFTNEYAELIGYDVFEFLVDNYPNITFFFRK